MTPIRDALLGPGDLPERLKRSLVHARRFFDTTEAPALLDQLLGSHAECRLALGSSVRLDHIGLLVPAHAEDLLGPVAAGAGFPLDPTRFPSNLLARELGTLVGEPLVPTTVCKQHGRNAAGAPIAVEAFVPEADDRLVDSWIERGVGLHVAVEVSSPRVFGEVRRRFPAAGLAMPAWMGDRPWLCDAEGTTIMYFELGEGCLPSRLEVRGQGDLTDPATASGQRSRARSGDQMMAVTPKPRPLATSS